MAVYLKQWNRQIETFIGPSYYFMMCINMIYFFIVQSRKNVAFVTQVWVDVLKFSSYITFADYFLSYKNIIAFR
jgi:hypothetical protein